MPQLWLRPEQAQLEVLRHWAAGDTGEPLSDDLRRVLHAAHCHAEAGDIRHLLVDLGQWQPHHLPSLERTTWELGFPAELQAEAVAPAGPGRGGPAGR